MDIIKTEIEDLIIIKPAVFKDERGEFYESYSDSRYDFIKHSFVQHNISVSKKDVIRGLHYQVGEHAQGKLCQVVFGTALDVAVDIRKGSPTYSKYILQILSDENNLQLWIPPGFAHGFCALTDQVIFNYKCTEYYSREHERCILYNDPDLDINWITTNPIVSEKDKMGMLFREIENDFIYEKMK